MFLGDPLTVLDLETNPIEMLLAKSAMEHQYIEQYGGKIPIAISGKHRLTIEDILSVVIAELRTEIEIAID